MVGVVLATATTGWFALGVVAVVAIAWLIARTRARGHRLERRMVRELGYRWEPTIPASPDPELQITLEELLEQRNELLEQFQEVQEEIRKLRAAEARRRQVTTVDEMANVVMLRGDAGSERNARRGN